MRAHIKIPRGWRRLRSMEEIRIGDYKLSECGAEWIMREKHWAGKPYIHEISALTIRKIKARKGGKAK